MTRAQRLMKNALTMTASALIMRSVALVFNSFVTSKVGAVGMGLYTLVASVYTFGVTFASSGIYLAITRLLAEAIGRGDSLACKKLVRRAALYSLTFGTVASAVVFFASSYIGEVLLGDARTVPSLRLMAAGFVPVALSATFTGYFTAMRRSVKCAAAQIFEQAMRISFTTTLLLAFMPRGIEYACLALVGGTAISETLSFLFIFAEYILDKGRRRAKGRGERAGIHDIVAAAMPIALSSYVRSALVTVEHMLIPRSLYKHGGDRDIALASYAAIHGMALPLVLYPTAVLYSFTGLVVPEVAEAHARGEEKRLLYMTERALSITVFFGIGVAVTLGCSSGNLGVLVYSNTESGRYIAALAPLIPVMYLDSMVDAHLKGLGKQVYAMVVNIVDASLSVVLVTVLLPRFGPIGYVYVLYICELVNFTLSVVHLHRYIPFRFDVVKYVIFPLGAAAGAVLVTGLVSHVHVILKMLVTVATYGIGLILLGAFPVRDVRWLLNTLAWNQDKNKAPSRTVRGARVHAGRDVKSTNNRISLDTKI